MAAGNSRDPRVRANVTWSPDSKAFVVTRNDKRKVGELYLVNNLANPRPTLMSYTLRDAGRRERRAGRALALQRRRHEAHAGEREALEGSATVSTSTGT